MRTTKPRERKSPNLATAQLVACVDGPLRGQWFYLDDWRERVEATQRMVDLDQRVGPALLYDKPSRGDLVSHPHFDGVAGMAVRCGR